jgi:hypothetical protein
MFFMPANYSIPKELSLDANGEKHAGEVTTE